MNFEKKKTPFIWSPLCPGGKMHKRYWLTPEKALKKVFTDKCIFSCAWINHRGAGAERCEDRASLYHCEAEGKTGSLLPQVKGKEDYSPFSPPKPTAQEMFKGAKGNWKRLWDIWLDWKQVRNYSACLGSPQMFFFLQLHLLSPWKYAIGMIRPDFREKCTQDDHCPVVKPVRMQ